MSKQLFTAVLSRYLPSSSIPYCVRLWEEVPFDMTVTQKRNSKLGDYSFCPREKRHKITINGDLNPYSFLVTYIHEVAHYRTYLQHGFAIKPHGPEWKKQFSFLMHPLLYPEVFPDSMLPPLRNYFANPKASSCSDLALLKALRTPEEKAQLFLSEVKPGEQFRFQGKFYEKEKKLRTRSLCREIGSGRKYFISDGAAVEVISSQSADNAF